MTEARADDPKPKRSLVGWYAFGYFLCYVPYSALAKALSGGRLGPKISGLSLLPLTTITSALAMFVTITWLGWWKYAGTVRVLGRELPFPTRWTFLSGVATAVIVVTTTLAYTFHDVSIPLVMLLMRGGVLMLAPLVDLISKRRVRWFSWGGLILSALALFDAALAIRGGHFPILCAVDIALYVLGYFVRLRFMSHLAKTDDRNVMRRYFVEEQMVATPFAVTLLAGLALVGGQLPVAVALKSGFVDVFAHPSLHLVLLAGLLSQGTGVFGGLVLLDASENTFCVPLNRASSILAGVVASFTLARVFGDPIPTWHELVGALALVAAIVVLFYGAKLDQRWSKAVAARETKG